MAKYRKTLLNCIKRKGGTNRRIKKWNEEKGNEWEKKSRVSLRSLYKNQGRF